MGFYEYAEKLCAYFKLTGMPTKVCTTFDSLMNRVELTVEWGYRHSHSQYFTPEQWDAFQNHLWGK